MEEKQEKEENKENTKPEQKINTRKTNQSPLFFYKLFVLHVQLYAPHVVLRSVDSESISHTPDCCKTNVYIAKRKET